MSRKILFRADGNSTVGLGHLYRIFALYEMLKKDFDCILITRSDSSYQVVPSDYSLTLMPESVSLENEAVWLKQQFGSDSIVVADGYQYTSDYQKSIKVQGFKLVYIDDLVEYHMFADLVINHAPSVQVEQYSAEQYTKFAVGLKYALLRPLFLEAARTTRLLKEIKSVFICFGGADPLDLSYKATSAMLQFGEIEQINLVLGGAYPHRQIFDLQQQNQKIRIYRNLAEFELVQLMQNSHLAIAPSSTILLESMCVKMSVLTGYYADNQKLFYQTLIAQFKFEGLGLLTNISIEQWQKGIRKVLDDFKINTNLPSYIDGFQSDRIKILIREL